MTSTCSRSLEPCCIPPELPCDWNEHDCKKNRYICFCGIEDLQKECREKYINEHFLTGHKNNLMCAIEQKRDDIYDESRDDFFIKLRKIFDKSPLFRYYIISYYELCKSLLEKDTDTYELEIYKRAKEGKTREFAIIHQGKTEK